MVNLVVDVAVGRAVRESVGLAVHAIVYGKEYPNVHMNVYFAVSGIVGRAVDSNSTHHGLALYLDELVRW